MLNNTQMEDQVHTIVKVLNWCDKNKVSYSSIKRIAELTWSIETGKSVYACGELARMPRPTLRDPLAQRGENIDE